MENLLNRLKNLINDDSGNTYDKKHRLQDALSLNEQVRSVINHELVNVNKKIKEI